MQDAIIGLYKVAGAWNELAWMLRTGTEVAEELMSWSSWTKEAAWKLGKVASSLWEVAWLRSSLSHCWEVASRQYTAFGK